MEFWGVEVKSGTPLKVKPGKGRMIHLSQATIGEVKANKEAVSLFVTVDGKKLVLGTLLSDKLPQQQLDLVFEKDFQLSHNSKSGSIYFFGYKGIEAAEDEEGFDSDDSEEEDIFLAPGKGKAEIVKPVVPEKAEENKGSAAAERKVKIVEPTKDEDDDSEDDDTDTEEESDSDDSEEEDIALVTENGKREIKAEKQKSIVAPGKAKESKASAAGKQKVKIDEPTKEEKPEDDDTEDDDSDEDETSDGDSMDEDDSEESEEDEETPKKVDVGKKRAAESAIKTPVPEKKAKLATPQKTDGKKNGGHVATPYPKKQVVKTQANKASQPTPKPGSLHSCGTCNKGFSSENALQSHTKAKHSAGK